MYLGMYTFWEVIERKREGEGEGESKNLVPGYRFNSWMIIEGDFEERWEGLGVRIG